MIVVVQVTALVVVVVLVVLAILLTFPIGNHPDQDYG